MKITCSIKKSISECADTWDSFLPADHHLNSRHLLAFESAAVDNIIPVYVQVFNKDQVIGLLYLQQFLFKHEHLNFTAPVTFYSRCLQALLPRQLPLLVCGHLFRIDFPGFYFKDPVRPTLVFEAIKIYLEENKRYKPCGVIIKDCETIYAEDIFSPFGYAFFTGDVTMELSRRTHWNSFDDYLADLNKNYLQRAKKIIKSFAGIRQQEFSAREILDNSVVIEQLYLNVVNKQSIKLGIVNAAYFFQLKLDLGANFEFHALYEKDVMVGFYTLIFNEHTMETHYIGLDYEVNQRAKLYFNILFKSTEKLISRKYASLELGRTAREAKVNLGALPKQIINYTRVKNPLVRRTVNYFLKRFNATASLGQVDRNPLK